MRKLAHENANSNKNGGEQVFLPVKLASENAFANQGGCFMDKKVKNDKPRERINRFIIECLFNKYFEEEKEDIIRRQEACPRRGAAPTEHVIPVR